jgi:hypothetical protein
MAAILARLLSSPADTLITDETLAHGQRVIIRMAVTPQN